MKTETVQRHFCIPGLICLSVFLLTAPVPAIAVQGETVRVSVDSSGAEGDGRSYKVSISADGRYVAFRSNATNLVIGDTNDDFDIFVHDRFTGFTTRVSVDSSGAQGNGSCAGVDITADGRYVAFSSDGSNLVAEDTNERRDVFVHDRSTGSTTRVSTDSNGTQGNDDSGGSSITADGRYVAFSSVASNLVAGDTNGEWDVFVHDRLIDQTTRVNVDSDGAESNGQGRAPSISADGRYVAFDGWATNLVAGDTNNDSDVFVHDRTTGKTNLVSIGANGGPSNGGSYDASISADGNFIAYHSRSSNLVSEDTTDNWDVFVFDRTTGETTRVSVDSNGIEGDGRSSDGAHISADGRYVAFSSNSSNLVAGDTNAQNDIFVHDRSTGATTRVNVKAHGNYYSAESNGLSLGPSISDDGLSIAFYSLATNLVVGDTNGERDVFVYTVHDTSGNPLWADADNLGQGWWWLDWFGSIRLDYDPWIYHQEHGWLYTAGTATDDLYFWDDGMAAICWTADIIYPFVHRFSDGDWLWYDSGTTPDRWFVRMSDGAWVQW